MKGNGWLLRIRQQQKMPAAKREPISREVDTLLHKTIVHKLNVTDKRTEPDKTEKTKERIPKDSPDSLFDLLIFRSRG